MSPSGSGAISVEGVLLDNNLNLNLQKNSNGRIILNGVDGEIIAYNGSKASEVRLSGEVKGKISCLDDSVGPIYFNDSPAYAFQSNICDGTTLNIMGPSGNIDRDVHTVGMGLAELKRRVAGGSENCKGGGDRTKEDSHNGQLYDLNRWN